jgi:hypothetical protein
MTSVMPVSHPLRAATPALTKYWVREEITLILGQLLPDPGNVASGLSFAIHFFKALSAESNSKYVLSRNPKFCMLPGRIMPDWPENRLLDIQTNRTCVRYQTDGLKSQG